MPLRLLFLLELLGGPVSRATAHVFLVETYSINQAATLPLWELHARYGARGVRFVGVFPAKKTTPAGLAAFAKTYQLAFSLPADAGHELTRQLHVCAMPEAGVVAADGRTVLYQGRLDDAYAGLVQPAPRRGTTSRPRHWPPCRTPSRWGVLLSKFSS